VDVSTEFLVPQTKCHAVDEHDVAEKVLRSDRKRLTEELAAAGRGSKRDVVKKYRLLVDDRTNVGG